MPTKKQLKEEETQILNKYNEGTRPKDIRNSVDFLVSYNRVLKILNKHKLPLEGSGGKNRIVNHNPFLPLTEEAQYWIGFLAADGNISTKKYTVCLKIKDIDHVLKFRDFVDINLPYHEETNQAGSLVRLVSFGNKETHEYLTSLGLTSKKSKTLEIKIPLTGHILRGVFDGDGSVSQNRPKITTGSLRFKNQLEKLYNEKGFKFTTTVKHKVKDKHIFDIWILEESRKDFFNFLYKDSTICLERKFNHFKNIRMR